MLRFLGYLFHFLMLSLISYFLFDVHLSILLLSVYMEFVDTIKTRVSRFIEKRKLKRQIIVQDPIS